MLVGERPSVNHRATKDRKVSLTCYLREATKERSITVQYLWIILGVATAAVVALPIAAAILVSMASHHEEAAHSLSGEAPSFGDRVARRVLGFKAAHVGPWAPGQMPAPRSARDREVRFAYARRSVSDPSEFRAIRQSQQDRIRLDQRQGAGV